MALSHTQTHRPHHHSGFLIAETGLRRYEQGVWCNFPFSLSLSIFTLFLILRHRGSALRRFFLPQLGAFAPVDGWAYVGRKSFFFFFSLFQSRSRGANSLLLIQQCRKGKVEKSKARER